uniref:Arginine vasopressin-induced protein 1 n=1 Tax=Calidris pygmaea TaxID=425635 RepID=A0A8C3KMC1_9CHAR
MGTPASVVSDPPGGNGGAVPATRSRKRASANIFQDVGLRELRSLFRSGGAERPEERARLVWRYAGQRRMARALRRLRRRRRRPAQPGATGSPRRLPLRAPIAPPAHAAEEPPPALPLSRQPPAPQGGP